MGSISPIVAIGAQKNARTPPVIASRELAPNAKRSSATVMTMVVTTHAYSMRNPGMPSSATVGATTADVPSRCSKSACKSGGRGSAPISRPSASAVG